MTAKETELQREMHEMVRERTELKEGFTGEKQRLREELNLMSEEIKSSKVSFPVTDSLPSDNSLCTLCLFVFVRPSEIYQTFFSF